MVKNSSIALCITRFSHGEKLLHVPDRASEVHYLSSDLHFKLESILRSLSKAVPFGVWVQTRRTASLKAGVRCGPGRIRTSVGVNRRVYSPFPLAARAPTQRPSRYRLGVTSPITLVGLVNTELKRVCIFPCMASFDVVSEIDMQEVRNAVDQAAREVNTRYDFKDTGSEVTLNDTDISLVSSSEDRLMLFARC